MRMNVGRWWLAAGLAVLLPVAGFAQTDTEGARVPPPVGEGVRASAQKGAEARRAEAVERFVQQLQKDRPEEFKRLTELRRNDPEGFRKEMRERWMKNRDEISSSEKQEKAEKKAEKKTEKTKKPAVAPEEKACLDLAQKYLACRDSAEAAQLKIPLQAAVETAFDKKTAEQEERLKAASSALELRKGKKAEICGRRVQELLGERRSPPPRKEARRAAAGSGSTPPPLP